MLIKNTRQVRTNSECCIQVVEMIIFHMNLLPFSLAEMFLVLSFNCETNLDYNYPS